MSYDDNIMFLAFSILIEDALRITEIGLRSDEHYVQSAARPDSSLYAILQDRYPQYAPEERGAAVDHLGKVESDIVEFAYSFTPNGCCALVGDLGCGKSSTLQYTIREFIAKALRAPDGSTAMPRRQVLYIDMDRVSRVGSVEVQTTNCYGYIAKSISAFCSDYISVTKEIREILIPLLLIKDDPIDIHHILRDDFRTGYMQVGIDIDELDMQDKATVNVLMTRLPAVLNSMGDAFFDYQLAKLTHVSKRHNHTDYGGVFIAIDNMDPLHTEVQRKVYETFGKVTSNINCNVIIALRPMTLARPPQAEPYRVGTRVISKIEHYGPGFGGVVRKRLASGILNVGDDDLYRRLSKQLLKLSGQPITAITDDGRPGVKLPKSELIIPISWLKYWLLSLLGHIIDPTPSNGENKAILPESARAFSAISGASVRVALLLAHRILSSHHTKIFEILGIEVGHDKNSLTGPRGEAINPENPPEISGSEHFRHSISRWNFLPAMMLGNSERFSYSEQASPIEDLFCVRGPFWEDSLVKLRILKWLTANGKLRRISDLLIWGGYFGYTKPVLLMATNHLCSEIRRLAYNDESHAIDKYSPLEHFQNTRSSIELTCTGQFYADEMVLIFDYMQEMAFAPGRVGGSQPRPGTLPSRLGIVRQYLEALCELDLREVNGIIKKGLGSQYSLVFGTNCVMEPIFEYHAKSMIGMLERDIKNKLGSGGSPESPYVRQSETEIQAIKSSLARVKDLFQIQRALLAALITSESNRQDSGSNV